MSDKSLDDFAEKYVNSLGVFPNKREPGCYETRMAYEIRDYIIEATEAGANFRERQILEMLSSERATEEEGWWWADWLVNRLKEEGAG